MAGRRHDRQRGAEHVEVPVEVHAEQRLPVVLGAVGEAGRARDACDVDDRVEGPELVDEPREQVADGGRVGDRDVRSSRTTAGVDDPLRRGELLILALRCSVDRDARVDGDDEHPVAAELLGDRGADAHRTAGDDGDARGIARRAHASPSPPSSSQPAKSPLARHSARRSRYPKTSP